LHHSCAGRESRRISTEPVPNPDSLLSPHALSFSLAFLKEIRNLVFLLIIYHTAKSEKSHLKRLEAEGPSK